MTPRGSPSHKAGNASTRDGTGKEQACLLFSTIACGLIHNYFCVPSRRYSHADESSIFAEIPGTRTRLMRAFNPRFSPDILVCSQVMSEGVDLQRFCRHVIHHDLDWNPSTIEQRTGRIARLGCKAEGQHPIAVYLPYLAGAADERQYRVMSDRERWFRVVMGENDVAKLITAESTSPISLPQSVSNRLNFSLGLEEHEDG